MQSALSRVETENQRHLSRYTFEPVEKTAIESEKKKESDIGRHRQKECREYLGMLAAGSGLEIIYIIIMD